MLTAGTSSTGNFVRDVRAADIVKHLRTKRKGQPVFVLGHIPERKGQEATFQVFNERLAVVKFSDNANLGFEPSELLLPTEIDDKGIAYLEIRQCTTCDQHFPLTVEEVQADQEPTTCPQCQS